MSSHAWLVRCKRETGGNCSGGTGDTAEELVTGGAQRFRTEKAPVGNAGFTEPKSGENQDSFLTLFTGIFLFKLYHLLFQEKANGTCFFVLPLCCSSIFL